MNVKLSRKSSIHSKMKCSEHLQLKPSFIFLKGTIFHFLENIVISLDETSGFCDRSSQKKNAELYISKPKVHTKEWDSAEWFLECI